jgi:hypothetical protein
VIPRTWRDFWSIYQLQEQAVRLDLKASLLRPASPFYYATARSLPSFGIWAGRVLTVVIHERGRAGFIQARWRKDVPVLDLLFIAPALDVYHGTAWLWQRLVQELVYLAVEHDAQRLFTHFPEDNHAEIEVMRQSGFAIYGKDRLYRLKSLPFIEKGNQLSWKKRSNVDEWGLTKLYLALTPSVVQHAESMMHDRKVRYAGWWCDPHHKGYVLHGEVEGDVLGYLSLTRGLQAHWLKLVLHPERVHLGSILLKQGLSMMRDWPKVPIYCDVRDYEGVLTHALEQAGFEHIMTRTLLVRHTTSNIRVKATKSRTEFSGTPETAPTPF